MGPPRTGKSSAVAGAKSRLAWSLTCSAALIATAGLLALGSWQMERRAWKHRLIARVQAQLSADPIAPPRLPAWNEEAAAQLEYRRVRASGVLDQARETLVQASTDLGAGYWVLTPLILGDGERVLVNRGFIPLALKDRQGDRQISARATVVMTGLVRAPETRCGPLTRNQPEAGRWCSRDVSMIAAAGQVDPVLPYFIDADAAERGDGYPRGGLTRIAFSDNHLVYALTWYMLALMALLFAVFCLLPPGKLALGDDD